MRNAALVGLFVLGLSADLFGQGAAAPGAGPNLSPQSTTGEWRDPRFLAVFSYGGALSEATDGLREAFGAGGYAFDSGSHCVVGFDLDYRFYRRWSAGIVAVHSAREIFRKGDNAFGAVVEADYRVSSVGLVLSKSFSVKPLRQGQIEVSAGFGPAWHVVRSRDTLDSSAPQDRHETGGYIAQAGAQVVGGRKRTKLVFRGGAQYRKVGRGGIGPWSARTGFPAVPRP